ncbi:hypothetical protein GO730_13690 [Spirosoma sp. HMF3257]|uniref:Sulfatase-like hydrolase/transferase n=1 Tax=Spirosoma telluris TaxID=2183553 RepID=A0A327NQP3_9BACT|nr:hypothetical protein [Spirosoma telluris]RAI75008.1 hypothetical protein HMF3257_13610 [Spirosoma telluris]
MNSQGKVDKKIQEVGHFTKEEMKGLLNDDPGDDRLGDERRERVLMQSYLNHIQEANRYMNLLVHSILTNSKRPPIILMMSDHGYRFLTGVSPQEKALERYGNLCAFYFPDHHYQMLSDSITPVNYMRLILSKALGEAYPLLPNKSNLVVDRNPFMVTHQE